MISKNKNLFWTVRDKNKWEKKPYIAYENIGDFLDDLGYPGVPHVLTGDELDFCAIFEHPDNHSFLFHLSIDNFEQIIFAEDLPAMFYLMEQSNFLIVAHFRAKKIVRELRDE